MVKILENLQSTVVFSKTDIAEAESYIANRYSTFSDEDAHKVLIHYLQQKMERDFSCFDPKYLSYIRSRLIQNILDRRPYYIMAIDILKACMQLNIQFDDFYTNLRKWMLSLNYTAVSEADIDRFITQLRHLTRDYPGLSFDELIQTHQHLFAGEPASPAAPAQAVSISQTKSDSFGSTVKLFLDELDWNPLETEDSTPPNRLFTVTKVILAGVAGLLISLAAGIWLALSFNKEPAPKIASRQWTQSSAVQAQVSGETAVYLAETTSAARVGANTIVNRSRSLVRSTPVPDTAKLQKKPDKSGELPEIRSAIVDYDEVTKDGTTSKIPVFHNFSKKLVAPIRIYSRSSDDNATDYENFTDDKTPVKAKDKSKGKTVVVDPGTIAPGSRVYLKFPTEYHYLNGVYLTEDPEGANGDTQISIAAKGDHPVKEGMVPTLDCDQVEVYVLGASE